MTQAENTTTATAAPVAPKFVPKIKAHVTVPLMKITENTQYYVRFTGPIHLGKEISGNSSVDPETGEVKSKKEPAYVAMVDNLETEDPVQIIVSTVMRKEMLEQYPNGSYVGKCFQFSMVKPRGKSYNVPQIAEIEDPNPEKGDAAAAKFAATNTTADAVVTDSTSADAKPATKGKK